MTSTSEAATTPAREESPFIGRLQELLTSGTDPELTLINIFQELPITNPASVLEIRGRFLELSTTELQLAAISHCRETYIRSPHLAQPVLGLLESLDLRRGLVRLANFSSAEVLVENRETVRVRFKRPTGVVIHTGSGRIAGTTDDISLGGCCIAVLVRQGVPEGAEVQVELRVIDKTTGLPNCTRIPGRIVQVHGETPPFKCVCTFRHNQQTEHFLSVLINQRQLEILRELREVL